MSEPLTDIPEDACKVAEIHSTDNFAHLWWRDTNGAGRRIAPIDWPSDWPETVSVERMKADGFKVIYRD